jgi:hypothetical protein
MSDIETRAEVAEPARVMQHDGGHVVFDFRLAPVEGVSYRAPFVVRHCRRCGALGERHDAHGRRMRTGSEVVHVLRATAAGTALRVVERCFVPDAPFPAVGDVFEELDKEGDVQRTLVVVEVEDEVRLAARRVQVRNRDTGHLSRLNGWRLIEEPAFLRVRGDEAAAVDDAALL